MTVHDELLALCADMHAAGEKLTYETLRDRRGGGSRRDIAQALRTWHGKQARFLAETVLDLPDDITTAGGEFAAQLWARMSERVAERLRDLKLEGELGEHFANQEIGHLHEIVGKQMDEIDRLRLSVADLEREQGRRREGGSSES